MFAFLADVDSDFRFGSLLVAENVIHASFLSFFNGYYRCPAPGVKGQVHGRMRWRGDEGEIRVRRAGLWAKPKDH